MYKSLTLGRYVDRHISWHSADMTIDRSVECWSICRPRCPRARRKNRWLAEKSVATDFSANQRFFRRARCLGACSSAFRWQFAGASFEHFVKGKREHRKARIILDFCPDGTSTCRREWGLSNSKYMFQMLAWFCRFLRVLFLMLLFPLSVGVVFIISVPSTASGSICFVYLQYTFCCRFWYTDDLTQWTHHNWKVSQVFLSFLS